jgi:hypothetical protein
MVFGTTLAIGGWAIKKAKKQRVSIIAEAPVGAAWRKKSY